MRAKQLLQANSFHSERDSHRSVISYCSTTREWCFLVDTSALVGTNLGNVANFCIDRRSGGISAIVGGRFPRTRLRDRVDLLNLHGSNVWVATAASCITRSIWKIRTSPLAQGRMSIPLAAHPPHRSGSLWTRDYRSCSTKLCMAEVTRRHKRSGIS